MFKYNLHAKRLLKVLRVTVCNTSKTKTNIFHAVLVHFRSRILLKKLLKVYVTKYVYTKSQLIIFFG